MNERFYVLAVIMGGLGFALAFLSGAKWGRMRPRVTVRRTWSLELTPAGWWLLLLAGLAMLLLAGWGLWNTLINFAP